MALAFSLAQPMLSALPVISTTTVGLPEATTASKSCCCIPGRLRSSRSQFSPQVRPKAEYLCEFSPTTTMLTSAAEALKRAIWIPFASTFEILQPKHSVSIETLGIAALRPSRTVMTLSSDCGTAQSPRMVWLLAFGPTTKTRRGFFSGSVPSFFSSTSP